MSAKHAEQPVLGDGDQSEAELAETLPPLDEYNRAGAAKDRSWNSLRQQVLELLWTTKKPLGPYDIADQLGATGPKKHPNSIYRTMKRLEALRLVIPIVSWSRYVISPDPKTSFWGVILCSKCKNFSVVPMPDEGNALWSVARGLDFTPERSTIECVGICQVCAAGEQP